MDKDRVQQTADGSRIFWVIRGQDYANSVDAEEALRAAGFSAKDAGDYTRMLLAEYHKE